MIQPYKWTPRSIEFLHRHYLQQNTEVWKLWFPKVKASLMTSRKTSLLVTRTATSTQSLACFPLHSVYPNPFNTCTTVFICYMWKVRLVYRVSVRACSILTSTAAIAAPFSPLTASILRPFNSPHQTFTFTLSLMCFPECSETQMFALCFLLSSATQEMLPCEVIYFLKQTTVTGGST
jgi:hypothetical protein